ncbi:MAG: PAS domain-containing protein [Alphaproteobacteria bacterium]|nr:PAS domain-containing protein [Alphaproteobacteria bacterium]
MRTETNDILFAYWNAVRSGRMAPRRFEIEPSQIASILPDTFILEFEAPSAYYYRLAGTRICETLDRELRGEQFVEGWRENDRFALQRHLTSVRKLGAVSRMLIEAASPKAELVRFELLILPLMHSGESIDRFLGALVAIDPPNWLGTRPLAEFRIIETESTYPADDVAEETAPTAMGPRIEPPVLPNIRSARIVRQQRRQFRVYQGGLSQTGKET